jgi:hypothetical protein
LKAKLIGRKHIRFLDLMSSSHEHRFLEEAGSNFAILHEEDNFSSFSYKDQETTCWDLALKGFVASGCLARKLEREQQEAKDSSTAATTSLQTQVVELEWLLASK